jgi:hypothetical protein
MDTLDIILIVAAVVLGLAWWMRRRSRMQRQARGPGRH